MMTIYILANTETICDGYIDDRTDCWKEEIATAAVDAAYRELVRGGIDPGEIQAERNFASWHGGKCSHQQKMYGLTGSYVVYPANIDGWARWLCEFASDAFATARDEYIARLEREHEQREQDTFNWARSNQGFEGTYEDWLSLDDSERDEYENGAAGIGTV